MKITDRLAIAIGTFTTEIRAALTANRVLTLPDKSGTIATVADIPTTRLYAEILTPTGVNTFPAMARAPIIAAGKTVKLIVNGQVLTALQGDFAVSGTTITWSAVNAGFNVDASYSVIVEYEA